MGKYSPPQSPRQQKPCGFGSCPPGLGVDPMTHQKGFALGRHPWPARPWSNYAAWPPRHGAIGQGAAAEQSVSSVAYAPARAGHDPRQMRTAAAFDTSDTSPARIAAIGALPYRGRAQDPHGGQPMSDALTAARPAAKPRRDRPLLAPGWPEGGGSRGHLTAYGGVPTSSGLDGARRRLRRHLFLVTRQWGRGPTPGVRAQSSGATRSGWPSRCSGRSS